MYRLLLLLLISTSALGQFNPTSSKTRFSNGIGLGSKLDAAFGTADSLVLYTKLDSTLMFKYKGTARALMFASNVSSIIHDSLYAVYQLKAGTSAGGRLVSNGGTVVAEWGVGGGSNFDFHGFAGYNANRSASYTARSFTDKGYVDSIQLLNVTGTGVGDRVMVWSGTSTATSYADIIWSPSQKHFGINKAAPTSALDVIGQAGTVASFRNTTAINSQILIGNSAGDLQLRALSTGDGLLYSDVGKYLAFGTNGASERMRLVSGAARLLIATTIDDGYNIVQSNGSIKSTQYRLSALNTAPSSASDTGTLGEIRITSTYIYVCTATNTWVRSALATW